MLIITHIQVSFSVSTSQLQDMKPPTLNWSFLCYNYVGLVIITICQTTSSTASYQTREFCVTWVPEQQNALRNTLTRINWKKKIISQNGPPLPAATVQTVGHLCRHNGKLCLVTKSNTSKLHLYYIFPYTASSAYRIESFTDLLFMVGKTVSLQNFLAPV